MTKSSLWRILIRNVLWLLGVQLIIQGGYSLVGWQGGSVYGVFSVIGLLADAVLPVLLVKLAFRNVQYQVDAPLKMAIFLFCWLPLLLNAVVGVYLTDWFSGYDSTIDPLRPEHYQLAWSMTFFHWLVSTAFLCITFFVNKRRALVITLIVYLCVVGVMWLVPLPVPS